MLVENRYFLWTRVSPFAIAATHRISTVSQHTATHCNTLQHTATHLNTLQHTATHCNTLQRTEYPPCPEFASFFCKRALRGGPFAEETRYLLRTRVWEAQRVTCVSSWTSVAFFKLSRPRAPQQKFGLGTLKIRCGVKTTCGVG